MGFRDDELLEQIADAVEKAFGLPAQRLDPTPVPDHTFNSGRGQYHSTSILKTLLTRLPEDALRLLAVTDVDLFVPQLNFVFGEAAVDGKVCVISLYRLHPEFYGRQPDHALFLRRAVTEAVHELGHTFGLHHCSNPRCVMFFSSNIEDTDRKSPVFCGECAQKLRSKLNTIKKAA